MNTPRRLVAVPLLLVGLLAAPMIAGFLMRPTQAAPPAHAGTAGAAPMQGTPTPTPTCCLPTATDSPTLSPIAPPASATSNAPSPTATTPPSNTPRPTNTRRASTPTPLPPTPTSVPASATPTLCAVRFSDVHATDYFYTPVLYLACGGVISGYADGTFRPYNQTTRSQMVKIVVLGFQKPVQTPAAGAHTFADVPTTHPFFDVIETAAALQIVSGYSCGGAGEPCDGQHRPYFRPYANVTRGQLSKIVVGAAGWTPTTPTLASFADVPLDSPFAPFVETAACRNILSGYSCGGPGEACDPYRRPYFRPGNLATRGQIAKIVYGAITNPAPCVFPSPQPTSTATPTQVAGGPCPVFPADNIWNRNIAAVPTHTLSAQYIANTGLDTGLHADFGSGLWAGGPIGIPYTTVTAAQPFVPIVFTEFGDQSDPGPYPVPTNAPVEGGPNSTGDRHTLVIAEGNCTLYEMYHAYPQPNGSWEAGSGAVWRLTSNALRPATWTSADAAGLPILPGLVRYDEVASGVIRHALRFTVNTTQRSFIWPARHQAGGTDDLNYAPMGLRVRLKASVDISGYPPNDRVILQAMKDYGMFVADNGSDWYISGAPDERWDNDELHLLGGITGSDFEAIDESGLMIDPNSGQSR